MGLVSVCKSGFCNDDLLMSLGYVFVMVMYKFVCDLWILIVFFIDIVLFVLMRVFFYSLIWFVFFWVCVIVWVLCVSVLKSIIMIL